MRSAANLAGCATSSSVDLVPVLSLERRTRAGREKAPTSSARRQARTPCDRPDALSGQRGAQATTRPQLVGGRRQDKRLDAHVRTEGTRCSAPGGPASGAKPGGKVRRMGEQAMLDQRSAALAAEYRANGWWRDRTLVDDFLDASAERLDRAAVVTYRSGQSRARDGHLPPAPPLRRPHGRRAARPRRPAREVVSMQLPNGWEFVALSLACARVGAVVNPLVPDLPPPGADLHPRPHRGPRLRRACDVPGLRPWRAAGPAGPRAVHAGARLRARRAGRRRPTATWLRRVAASRSTSWQRRWEDRPGLQAELDRRRPGGDDLAEIQFTSGHHRRAQGRAAHLEHGLVGGPLLP